MIDLAICTRDRVTELTLLLESLRHQTEGFDIFILDDASGTPLMNFHFFVKTVNQLKIEGHKVVVLRNEISQGVCAARQKLNDYIIKHSKNEYVCRLDDDVILEETYLSRLLFVIRAGYDVASGVTPVFGQPEMKREIKFVSPIINKHSFDSEGNLIEQRDDCGFSYLEEETSLILPTHQFRSCALFKREVVEKIKYEENLSFVGFREEGFYSFRCLIEGFKIGVDVQAKAWHLVAPSGGTRSGEYAKNVQLDDETFRKWCKRKFKEKGDFLKLKVK